MLWLPLQLYSCVHVNDLVNAVAIMHCYTEVAIICFCGFHFLLDPAAVSFAMFGVL